MPLVGLVSTEDGQDRIAIQVRLFSAVRNSQAREVIADTRQLRLQIKRVLDMESANWIKVSDRLPECTFGDKETMHYSRSVLVAMRWINGRSSYWIIRIACYDKLLEQWLDHNEVPYENVEYWQPIELPEEE